jgi:hypothetical protein
MVLKQEIIHYIEKFLKKEISLKQITSQLNKEKDYLLSLSTQNKQSHTEIAYSIYFSPETECSICGKEMKFSGFAKGYTCDKKCETSKRINSMSKEEVTQEIKNMYEKYNRPVPGDKDFKSFSQTCRKYFKLFWEKEYKESSLKCMYDLLFGECTDTCKCCDNKVVFSYFKYSPCCSVSCMTKYQMTVLTPWTEERKIKMIENCKKTKLEKYGDETYTNPEKQKETRLKNNGGVWFTEEQLNKRKTTNLEKYGVEHVTQNEDIKKKVNETTFKNYGVYRFPNIDYDKIRRIHILHNRWISDEDRTDWGLYVYKVKKLTEQQNLHLLPNIEKRGPVEKEGSYHLDHKFSIFEGFKNNIPIYIIGNIHNLEMIPAKENISKNSKCTTSIEEILTLINKNELYI